MREQGAEEQGDEGDEEDAEQGSRGNGGMREMRSREQGRRVFPLPPAPRPSASFPCPMP